MDRLHHLKQTLIQNIKDNSDYQNLEFILLNYNSKDGMDEWVRENLMSYIESGRLIYFKTTSSDSWNPSHSKNVAFKLATGDILCNIWADYYTGANFANYVNESFLKDDNIVLTPIDFYRTKKGYLPPNDVLGKVCVKKHDFLKIRGFDERINKHGFEDYDFVNRLEMVNVKREIIENFDYLKYIAHEDNQRFDLRKNELEAMYISHRSPSHTKVLMLFNDSTFLTGVIIDLSRIDTNNSIYAYTARKNIFNYTLETGSWSVGRWKMEGTGISFSTNSELFHLYKTDVNGCQALEALSYPEIFFLLQDNELVNSVLEFKHYYDTRSIMESNYMYKTPIVNLIGFGEASVIRNFQVVSPD